jgi:3-hydroxyacyl-[acyl-carrier-protein] dehydratase
VKSIFELIPQRPPFLFVDKVISHETGKIKTIKTLTGDEDFFKGHFPGNPIMPGVLLQEALFQSAAALLSLDADPTKPIGLGVVTRVQNAKFKNMAKPNDELIMEVEVLEKLSNAIFCKGKTTVNEKTILICEFSVAEV